MAELDAICITAMLAADTDLQFATRRASLFNTPAHQHAHTFRVERLERIGRKKPAFFSST